jgi:hypothetical protein
MLQRSGGRAGLTVDGEGSGRFGGEGCGCMRHTVRDGARSVVVSGVAVNFGTSVLS